MQLMVAGASSKKGCTEQHRQARRQRATRSRERGVRIGGGSQSGVCDDRQGEEAVSVRANTGELE
jgi:hypothetical protein